MPTNETLETYAELEARGWRPRGLVWWWHPDTDEEIVERVREDGVDWRARTDCVQTLLTPSELVEWLDRGK